MKWNGMVALALSLALLTACGQTTTEAEPTPTPTAVVTPTPVAVKPIDFMAFQREVCDGRMALYETEGELDASAWMTDFPDQLSAFTETEMDALLTAHGAKSDFTYQDAREDVETFFLLLKTTYGAYDYFGGDEVFLPLKEQVLSALDSAPGPFFVRGLEDILVETLSPVLIDGHFSIGDIGLSQGFSEHMYYVPDLYFTDLTGLDTNYIKPTIAPDGSIQYWFCALSRDGSDLPTAPDGVALAWEKAGITRNNRSFAFLETETEGIPTLVSRLMFPDRDGHQAQLDRFASCGGEYAEKPLFLLDVRANPGGSDNWMMGWFEGFAGRPADLRRTGGHKYSPLAVRAIDHYARLSQGAHRWNTWSRQGTWTENDSTVFVLTDKGTASSGEGAVEFMRTVDNTLFVGGPTAGCSLVLNNWHFYLPHSGLDIYFGTGLSFCETMENRDGIGHRPDLWVNPAEADAAVARLCAYYGLTT